MLHLKVSRALLLLLKEARLHMNRTAEEKSIGTIVRELSEDLSSLVRNEIALAKVELRKTAANLGMVGAIFTTALFVALLSLVFFIVTAVLALIIVLPPWLATLCFAVGLLVVAVVLALVGRSKLSDVELAPTATMESVKSNVEAIKADLSRLKKE